MAEGIVLLNSDKYGDLTYEWSSVVNDNNTSSVTGHLYYEFKNNEMTEEGETPYYIDVTLYAPRIISDGVDPGWQQALADNGTSTDDIRYGEKKKISIYKRSTTHQHDFITGEKTVNIKFIDATAYSNELHALVRVENSQRKRIDEVDIDVADSFNLVLDTIPRGAVIKSASSFTDEENPNFVYGIVNDINTVTSIQAALSFDGETDLITYRDVPISDNYSYTFELTEAEKELLRKNSMEAVSKPIYFLTKTSRAKDGETALTVYSMQRTFTVLGCLPILNPQLRDVNSDTVALTGDENKFIRYESMAEFSTGAVASKYAEIVSQFVQCGSKVVYDLFNGVIDDVESDTFIFNVVDSRNLQAQSSVFTNMIPYVKPTCKQDVKIDITNPEDVDAKIVLKVSGAYYGGSFGAVSNTLLLEVRHTDDSGTMGDWEVLSNPTINTNNNTYELTKTYYNFRSDKSYVFQCRVTDKLNYVETAQYTIRLAPVFDWGEEDFNFNVPIKMNNKTIIRHNIDANNTVLSASGGHIYLRPKGTDDTSGQTILYPNGNVDFTGAVNFGNTVNFDYSFTVGGYLLADYVIETGEEAMGSNGTWYWRKWLSGKAEAWGCRNFGNMAVNNAWGSLYRSAVLTQNLPEDVFSTTPDAININFVHTNAGGWISKYENTAPSAVTTGSFVVVRPVSGNITPTNIGFYVVGQWY